MIPRFSQRGFSLLEVMIATAILAASAMVLLSLISLGTRFGSKAEMRIGALVQAQSILDESILRMHSGESIDSYSGVLPGSKPRGYRVTIEPFELVSPTGMGGLSGDSSFASDEPSTDRIRSSPNDGGFGFPGSQAVGDPSVLGARPTRPMPSELVSIKVELYESEVASAGPSAGSNAGGGKPLIELTRLVRRAPVTINQATTIPPSGGLRGR
jgi:prepilin-type N-terminal cleavage/methylation domain-containing protein